MTKTIAIIGGGPGGYVAAIRAAQLGATVHLVEETHLGGTCLNVGCIPTKALLHTTNLYQEMLRAAKIGVAAENIALNWTKAQQNKDAVVKKLVRGVSGLLAANGVTVHNGRATLKSAHFIALSNGDLIEAHSIILATGSVPTVIPFAGYDLPGVIDSTGALNLTELPQSICILGGGVIGAEFAHLFASAGVKVTIVEMLPQILPPLDGEIAAIARKNLESQGVTIHTSAKLVRVDTIENELVAIAEKDGTELRVPCEKLIVATGRRANTAGLGLAEIGVSLDRGKIVTDDFFATNIPDIFAIGDCNGKCMLAHAASAQGEAVVAHIMGQPAEYDATIVPSCVYVSPEAAAVGQTEEQLLAQGISYRVGRFMLSGNGKSLIEGCTNGMIKIIAAGDGTILGAHMIGPRVTDMIAEISLALHQHATIDDLTSTIHAHPTISEAVVEAALDVDDRSIHWPPRTK